VNPYLAVVLNKTRLAEPVHEEVDTGPGGSDHLRQGFLRDLRNQRFRIPHLAEFRHQQEDSRQTLLAEVKELIDKISLGAHTAGQQKRQKQV
jgi:hypothetical protein